MRINSEILDIRAFLAVLDDGSFHKAAERLGMSQPAVTRRVKSLERAFGARLLERSTRRISLTKVGRQLDPLLRRVVDGFDDCALSLGGEQGRQPGEVTVAAVPTAAAYFLPRALKRFTARHPDVRLRILDLSADEGIESVVRGEAEFGVNFLGASRPELKFTPLVDDGFVVACRTDHAFASKRKVRWKDLSNQRLIISQRSGNRALIDQALARSDLQLNWAFQVIHVSTSFGLVEAGLGISILPRMARPTGKHPDIAVVPLGEPTLHRTVGIVERRIGQLSRPAAALRDALLEEAAAYVPQPRSKRAPRNPRPVSSPA
jgi:DNA-binding transcriptional LysR family regulator